MLSLDSKPEDRVGQDFDETQIQQHKQSERRRHAGGRRRSEQRRGE